MFPARVYGGGGQHHHLPAECMRTISGFWKREILLLVMLECLVMLDMSLFLGVIPALQRTRSGDGLRFLPMAVWGVLFYFLYSLL